jgi:hypothetical protein
VDCHYLARTLEEPDDDLGFLPTLEVPFLLIRAAVDSSCQPLSYLSLPRHGQRPGSPQRFLRPLSRTLSLGHITVIPGGTGPTGNDSFEQVG